MTDLAARLRAAHALRSAGDVNGAVSALVATVNAYPGEVAGWMALGRLLMEIAAARPEPLRSGVTALEGAIEAFRQAVALAPDSPVVLASAAMAERYACNWDAGEAHLRALHATLVLPARPAPFPPMIAAALIDDPALLLRSARDQARTLPPAPAAPAAVRTRGTRLRVGYLSCDFHEHATAYLAAGLFEAHDRARVTTFAYAYDRDDGGPMRRRLLRAFDHWRDVRECDDEAAARLIAGDALDVLVDLKGPTQNARLGIVGRRPAPVQVHYLGFPGTTGVPGIDAIVADPVVVPGGAERDYAERVLRLPACYQANDRARPLPAAAARAAAGLPERAFVLCSFNQPYKLTRPFVDAWLAALAAHDDAVLWLAVPHPVARRHLHARARELGVDPARVVFADHAPQAAHLARLRCADLALDVLPYGSHTTGSDALWVGVPLLTVTGRTFAGRVGTSLVGAAGLPQFAMPTFDAYVARLGDLLARRDEVGEARAHLERERLNLPLFDTAQFARDFEALLAAAANG